MRPGGERVARRVAGDPSVSKWNGKGRMILPPPLNRNERSQTASHRFSHMIFILDSHQGFCKGGRGKKTWGQIHENIEYPHLPAH